MSFVVANVGYTVWIASDALAIVEQLLAGSSQS
jgi:hypothetical protein